VTGCPACPSDWITTLLPFAQLFGPAIGWLVAIVGWVIVSRSNDKRETRKELRAFVDAVRDLVAVIEDKAYEYYQTEHGASQSLALGLKRDIARLAGVLNILKAANGCFSHEEEMKAFRQAVTGKDFESREREVCAASDRLFLEISTAAQDVIEVVEAAFAKAYPRKSSWKKSD
jgi:hypothetical protein